jgi:hypothetical protein
MPGRSPLRALARAIRWRFEAYGVTASVRLGWRQRTEQDPDAGNRVVLVPGIFDPSAGLGVKSLRAGRFDRDAPQNYVDHDPRLRAVAWWHEPVTFSVWAVSDDDPQDEEAQIEATEDLCERTIDAIHNAVDPETQIPIGYGNVEDFGDPYWTLPPVEKPFGRELTFGIVLLVPQFETPSGLAFPSPVVQRNPAT